MSTRSAAVRVMVRLMLKGPSSIDGVAEELGLERTAVKNAVRTLRKLKFVDVVGRGRRKISGNRGAIPYLYGSTVERG